MNNATCETDKVDFSGPRSDRTPEQRQHSSYHQPGVLPVLQTRDQIKAFYNKIAKVYDLLAEHSEKRVRIAGLEMLDAHAGEKVLEIGFGTGHCLVELAQAVGSSGSVFGIDLSDEMLLISRKRARHEGLEDRIELTCGDALCLPYPSESMDAVFMSFTLELFDTPEIIRVLTECMRILKPGGRIVVVGMSRVVHEGMIMKAFEWTHRHFPNFLDCRPILVRGALEDAGFVVVDNKMMKMWINVEIVRGVKAPIARDGRCEIHHLT
jgi:demethylmenaquinone methyltransferase/2-methoxy-6-polyprenyl-1,4-benzoquinol methylase